MKYSNSNLLSRVALAILLFILVLSTSISCSRSSGIVPVVPDPEPEPWNSPVFRYRAEVFPHDYLVGKEYQFTLVKNVSDIHNALDNEFVVGLYTKDGALYPYLSTLHMVSVGDLYVNEFGRFTALDPGQKTLKVEVRDEQNRLYTTIIFGPYFGFGLDWDSPVKRFNIEIQPSKYVVGQFYDMELISNISDIIDYQSNQIMIGLYRKSDEGVLFSETIGLKFIPSGDSLYINEFGRFSSDSAGEKTVIAEVVDNEGHLFITVVFHPIFVMPGTDPPPPSENHPPIIDSFSPTQNPVVLTVGDNPQLFTVTSHDPDGDSYNTRWHFGNEGPVKQDNYLFDPKTVGEWTLEVVLSDGNLQARHSWIITVCEQDPEPNHAPVIDDYFPEQNNIILTVGDPAQIFNVSGHDPDGDLMTEWWMLEGNDLVDSNGYTFYPDTIGEWALQVFISDGELHSEIVIWNIEVQDVSIEDNNLYPIDGNGDIVAYYSDNGLQSIALEVQAPGFGVGFILWEIIHGSSGAMTVPLGEHPKQKCEFYYESVGIYTVWATPYSSEGSYQSGGLSIGNRAIFTITVING